MVVVPRVLERIHQGITAEIAAKGPMARRIFSLVLSAGWSSFQAEQEKQTVPAWARLVRALFGTSVRSRVMAPLGGRLRAVVCGGAPLSADICREFLSLGISVLQGYGMTETSPVVSSNRIDDNVPESAGIPINGCEVSLGKEGELLVRSSSVMLGYWRKPEKTRETVDDEGWLHTGDTAEIRDGRIFVTGRLGDVVKLATGHKVPVGAVEEAILGDPLFSQAIIVAAGRNSVMAIAVLDDDNWRKVASELGVASDDKSALADEVVRNLALTRMARRLQQHPAYCRPQTVVLDLEPWSVEAGLLTPTLKAKRRNILAHYSEQADAAKSA